MRILLVSVTGRASQIRTKRGAHLVPRSVWSSRKEAKALGVERRVRKQLEGRHHLVTDDRVRDGVDRCQRDAGEAGEDPLHRRCREVLAVDAEPVGVATGEVEESFLVPVGQIAAPVDPIPQLCGARLRRFSSSPRSSPLPACWPALRSPARGSAAGASSSNFAGAHSAPVPGSRTSTPSAARPSAPGGMSGVRVTLITPSVEPKASVTTQPNRLWKRSMSCSVASLPKARTRLFSKSSGRSGVARM